MAVNAQGRVQFADHILGYLETAVRHSFEARRGKLHNALRALNAMLVLDLTRQVTRSEISDRNLGRVASRSLYVQMEDELDRQFRFVYVAWMAHRKFENLDGVVAALEKLIPQFVAEFEERTAAGKLDRKGGVLRWLTGTQEVGSIENLLDFCRASLWFAENLLDDGSHHAHLASRITALTDTLPR